MNDLTILYYTSSRISDFFGNNVRNHLLETTQNQIPIVSISHKPLDFGRNVCVSGEGWEPSMYNVYRQVFMAAQMSETEYVACCEDDSLYVPEHFTFRPPSDVFFYNNHRWNIKNSFYYFRERNHPTSGGMCMCIAPTKLMVDVLGKRFAKFPTKPESLIGFGEPGRYDHYLGLERPKSARFMTQIPTLTFVHRPSVGGIRRVMWRVDKVEKDLPYWGNATELWDRIHG